MPTLDYNFQFNVSQELVLSPSDIRSIYLFGIDVRGINGEVMSDDDITFYITSAQQELEKWLNLKFRKQVVEESQSFYRDDWRHWGFMRVTYPVVCPLKLDGFLNKVKQISYPSDWLTTKRINTSPELYNRNVYLVPAGSATSHSEAVIFSGLIPNLGVVGAKHIPNYWTFRYVTGWDRVPEDIINAVGKIASISVLNVFGDILLGAGIASQSLSIDGLSQSIGTTQSAENSAFSARIKQYLSELKKDLPHLKDYYRGFSMAVA